MVRFHASPQEFPSFEHPLYHVAEAVQRLQEEHCVLHAALETLISSAARVLGRKVEEGDFEAFRQLRDSAVVFRKELQEHARWEDDTLFPMIAWYLDEEPIQFTLIEQEHELADQYLQAFAETADRAPVRISEAKELASYLTHAAEHLKLHFEMEEELLQAILDRSCDE